MNPNRLYVTDYCVGGATVKWKVEKVYTDWRGRLTATLVSVDGQQLKINGGVQWFREAEDNES